MCGIIGYTGAQHAAPLLTAALQQLEYRGYDSAGLSIQENGELVRIRSVGYVGDLQKKVATVSPCGTVGIAHTRWATHGIPSENNAHPHSDTVGDFHVVHNGIIENHKELRASLPPHMYVSETDTEVIAHLMSKYYTETHSVAESFLKVCGVIKGSYAIALVSRHEPGAIYFARKSSPLLIGLADDGIFLCSDINPLLGNVTRVLYLHDGDMGFVHASHGVCTLDGALFPGEYIATPQQAAEEGLGRYAHYMEKEMHEAPQVIQSALHGRLQPSQARPYFAELERIEAVWLACKHVRIVACGTSFHAALYGKYIIESIAHVPVTVEIASEFRYKTYLPHEQEVVIVVSQSGETADTRAALQCAREHGIPTIGIVNVQHSTIAREVDVCILLHAGPEISVASTKACISQSVVLAALALTREYSSVVAKELHAALLSLSVHAVTVLERSAQYRDVLSILSNAQTVFCLGRGGAYPVALEAALKLKEVAYIHAEGYPGGELKHGSLALIDALVPTIVFVPEELTLREKMLSNIAEVRARGGKIISISSAHTDDVSIRIPRVSAFVAPIIHMMVAHGIAYNAGVMRSTSIDKPRNLAKAVTVE